VVLAAVVACLAAGCGKKGPPLPPLVKLPVAPTDLTADRRGSTVDLSVTLPASNTDGTRPANISRMDILALTAPTSTSDTVVLEDGVKVASVQVKAPKDPNDTVDVDDPDSDVEAPEGPGLDQGAVAHLHETLTPQAEVPWKGEPAKNGQKSNREAKKNGPLVGPPLSPPVRLYLAMGFDKHGRRGPVSKRVNVPLTPPPARAPEPRVTYDESAITVTWPDVAAEAAASAKASDVLPSRSLVTEAIKTAYNVYQVPSAGTTGLDVKLTSAPSADARFVQRPIEWGKERCFAVRTVELVDQMSIEGDRSPAVCVTPVDTFPPATPKKPTAIALAGAINILWDANTEPDLAGYLVFRGTTQGGAMTRLTPQPIERTNYTDEVEPNFRAFYAIEAVDKAGNISPMSPATDEETAR
jgi:hypothetical protein